MRYAGLTLCLVVSSLTARAESLKDRVVALEQRMKILEQALQKTSESAAAGNVDGSYKAILAGGKLLTLELKNGKAVASMGTDTKVGSYEIIGSSLVITAEGKVETLTIEGDHLRASKGGDKVDFVKSK